MIHVSRTSHRSFEPPVEKSHLPQRLLVLYGVLVVLVFLPLFLISSENAYQLFGEIVSGVWCALSAAVLFFVSSRLRSVSRQLSVAWFILAWSLVFSAMGNFTWLILSRVYHVDPYPSIADYFYLLGYPFFLAGILYFPYKKRLLIENIKIALETVTVVISMGLILWFFVLKPIVLQADGVPSASLWVTLVYFSVDTLLFMALWVLVAMKSIYLPLGTKVQLGASLLLLIFADTMFLVQDLQGLYFETIRVTDLAYNLNSIFLGMAGLSSILVPNSRLPAKEHKPSWLSNVHRIFVDLLLLASFYLFVVGHESYQLIDFKTVSFWVGFLILISIALQRLDEHEISKLNGNLRTLNVDLEKRVDKRTEELTSANLKLESAMRTKDEFMAAVSHELRTPLTGILGSVEALKMPEYGALTEKQLRSAGIIEQSGQRLLGLINDLIDYSRLQSNTMPMQMDSFSLPDICQVAMRSVSADVSQKKQSISLQMQPETIMLYSDAALIKKVLKQLLKNASKFTPSERSLGIQIEGNTQERQVEITVWDTGIGMNGDDLEKIFTPFVQVDARLSRHYEGTGLGLAIVKKIVELLQGSIRVASTPNEGSRFTIILPWQPLPQ